MHFMLSMLPIYYYYWYSVKFLKPNRHTKLKMDSDIHDYFICTINNKLDSTVPLLKIEAQKCGCNLWSSKYSNCTNNTDY
jgi:hypothetical protein